MGGNDFEISPSVIAKGDISITVVNWEETWEISKNNVVGFTCPTFDLLHFCGHVANSKRSKRTKII